MELGSTVKLLYEGRLEDGTIFGVARADGPMVFQTGMDLTIPGFETAILEMNEAGEKKTFTVGMYDAYGEYLEDNFQEIPREYVPIDVKIGKRTWISDDDGEAVPAVCVKATPTHYVFDMNHPLAGKDLTFTVELLEVTPPPEDFVPAAEKARLMERMTPHGMGESSVRF